MQQFLRIQPKTASILVSGRASVGTIPVYGYMNGPAVGNGQFNDARHEQKSRRCRPSGKAENEENGKDDKSGQEGLGCRRRIWVGPTGQMQHEFAGERIYRRIIELKKAIPFENAGPPERHRDTKAQHELDRDGCAMRRTIPLSLCASTLIWSTPQ